jgi:hypothetical protein
MTDASKVKITATNLKVLNEHLGTNYQHEVKTDIKELLLPSSMVRNVNVLYCRETIVLLPDIYSRYPLSVVVSEYFLKNFGDGFIVGYLTPSMAILDSIFAVGEMLTWLENGGVEITYDVFFAPVGRGRKLSR